MVKKFILAALASALLNLSQTKSNSADANAPQGNNLVSNKPFVEELGGQSLLAKIENNLSSRNLTEEFTKNLADKIAGENPSGIQIQDGEKILSVPDPNQITLD